MTTAEVTIPASLAFLVSNFQTLVTIKLDSTNYLLWKIQVENAMQANGFFSYLNGSIKQPASHVRSTEGVESVNPEFMNWKLIDAQLLSCLTASLSPQTLPYILGLHHAQDVWFSLSKRYDALSENNVQDLRTQLFEVTKNSTMEDYIDKIKEISQKLAAAGCVVEDKELVFHTLRGLPKTFNALKTAVRAIKTRGHEISQETEQNVELLKTEWIKLLPALAFMDQCSSWLNFVIGTWVLVSVNKIKVKRHEL